jgi:trans-aconitate 2-methyltransferase
VTDIGCGPGNSTELLWLRWPDAHVVGIDNSLEMIAAATSAFPNRDWIHGDVRNWNPSSPSDLVYSNAALQWLPHHEELVRDLFNSVAKGGALAFQIPSASYPLVRQFIFDISRASNWDQRMIHPRTVLTMETPAFYYDVLAAEAVSLDIWETEYMHVMNSKSAIVDWIASTGLRMFLAALDNDAERQAFTIELQRRVDEAYDERSDGKVLFPFRRTFVIAYR